MYSKKLLELLDDLGWEYDRMTSSGQESLDAIWKIVGLPTFKDIKEGAE